MTIILIVAFDNNQAIGKSNRLLWHLPNDLKRFKSLTSNHTVIMGRKTFESIGKPLPNRTNIVLTRDVNWKADGVSIFSSKENLIASLNNQQLDKVYIIGGAEIYNLFLEEASILEITHVNTSVEADTYFPAINWADWEKTEEISFKNDENHSFCYKFATYFKSEYLELNKNE